MLDQVRRGALVIEDLSASDYDRAAALLQTYADLKVGFVDCAVLAVTERLDEPKLATLDHTTSRLLSYSRLSSSSDCEHQRYQAAPEPTGTRTQTCHAAQCRQVHGFSGSPGAPWVEALSGRKLSPVLLDRSKRHNVVVKDRVDLDLTAQGAHASARAVCGVRSAGRPQRSPACGHRSPLRRRGAYEPRRLGG